MGVVLQLFLSVAVLTLIILIKEGYAHQIDTNKFRRQEQLDPQGKYLLSWETDWKTETITFNVTVATKGWVGFGVSNGGLDQGVDLVIGGVKNNHQVYFSDRHKSPGIDVAVLDAKQDWTLHFFDETPSHTFLSFSRAFDTCDKQDYQITLNKVSIHWSYGRNDNEDGLNPERRGTYETHLLDPDFAPQIIRRPNGDPIVVPKNSNENVPQNTQTWSVTHSLTLEPNETSYICSITKAPRLTKLHHFIGYDIHFPNDVSRDRTHHMLLYKCHPPPGVDRNTFFQRHLSNPGEVCYLGRTPESMAGSDFPIAYCSEIYLGWGIGGKAFFMPDDVGFPFGETEDEYYMWQMHYDNPLNERNVRVDARFDMFYTSQLRPKEGGIMSVTTELPGLPEHFLIPPNSRRHRLMTMCSPECTQRIFPRQGVQFFATWLHAHNACVGMRLRHFRGGKEMPWILYDDNYQNSLQPIRHYRNEITILPGDQLISDCHTSTNGTTVGGFSTRQEMCNSWIFYHRKIRDYTHCISGMQSPEAREYFLGLRNASWVQAQLQWVANTPVELAGLTVTQISDYLVDWTPQKRMELQRFHELNPQSGGCHKILARRQNQNLVPAGPIGVPPGGNIDGPDDFRGPVAYPVDAIPYVPPPRTCPVAPKRG